MLAAPSPRKMTTFTLCCDIAALEREPLLLLQVLQQFQTQGDDSQWRSLWHANECQLVTITHKHLYNASIQLDSSAMNADPNRNPCKQHMAIYVAAVNLLFVALSLDDSLQHVVACRLAQLSVTVLPLRHACGAADQEAVLLLRLQLLESVLQHAKPCQSMIEPRLALERTTLDLTHFISSSTTIAIVKKQQAVQDEMSVCDAALNVLFLLLGLSTGLSTSVFQSLLQLLSNASLKSATLHTVLLQQILTLLANESNDSRLLLVAMHFIAHIASLQQPCTEPLHLSVDELNRASLVLCERVSKADVSDDELLEAGLVALTQCAAVPGFAYRNRMEQLIDEMQGHETRREEGRTAIRRSRQFEQDAQAQAQSQVALLAKAKRRSLPKPPTAAAVVTAAAQPVAVDPSKPIAGQMPFSAQDFTTMHNATAASNLPATLSGQITTLHALLAQCGTPQEWTQELQVKDGQLLRHLVLGFTHFAAAASLQQLSLQSKFELLHCFQIFAQLQNQLVLQHLTQHNASFLVALLSDLASVVAQASKQLPISQQHTDLLLLELQLADWVLTQLLEQSSKLQLTKPLSMQLTAEQQSNILSSLLTCVTHDDNRIFALSTYVGLELNAILVQEQSQTASIGTVKSIDPPLLTLLRQQELLSSLPTLGASQFVDVYSNYTQELLSLVNQGRLVSASAALSRAAATSVEDEMHRMNAEDDDSDWTQGRRTLHERHERRLALEAAHAQPDERSASPALSAAALALFHSAFAVGYSDILYTNDVYVFIDVLLHRINLALEESHSAHSSASQAQSSQAQPLSLATLVKCLSCVLQWSAYGNTKYKFDEIQELHQQLQQRLAPGQQPLPGLTAAQQQLLLNTIEKRIKAWA